MELGRIVKEYRKEEGLSQRQFADLCGVSNGYISMIEEGKNPKTNEPIQPSLPMLKKLACAMDISLDILIASCEIENDIENNISGIRLKELREESGITLRELARLTNTSKSAIDMYERGERKPKYETLKALAMAFDVDIVYLLGESSVKKSASTVLNDDEQALLNLFRQIPQDRRVVYLEIGRVIVSNSKKD